MPHIIVMAERSDDGADAVMLRERVTVADFESDHFAAQLVERLGWAVSDADGVERQPAGAPAKDPIERHPAHRLERQPAEAPLTHAVP